MRVTNQPKHQPVEIARSITGLVNEVYVYTNEERNPEEKTYSYDLAIHRLGGVAMTDEEVLAKYSPEN